MRTEDAGLVQIVREFLRADRSLRALFARYRQGSLEWSEVQRLVGDDESSVLFRLKERCHALFRTRDPVDELQRVALFDLAVGSLFHESMKLRENFYQLVVYAPKVEALRQRAGTGSEALFHEFGRILSASRARLAEAVEETEALLEQTRRQLRVLLEAYRDNGLLTRSLLENAALAEEVLGEPLDDLFQRIHGDATAAYALASRSYLDSGYFVEAERALAEALARDPERSDLRRAAAYAAGMSAYLRGRYAEALRHLDHWVDAEPPADEAGFATLAHSAVAQLGDLVEGDEAALVERAGRLARRLEPLAAAQS